MEITVEQIQAIKQAVLLAYVIIGVALILWLVFHYRNERKKAILARGLDRYEYVDALCKNFAESPAKIQSQISFIVRARFGGKNLVDLKTKPFILYHGLILGLNLSILVIFYIFILYPLITILPYPFEFPGRPDLYFSAFLEPLVIPLFLIAIFGLVICIISVIYWSKIDGMLPAKSISPRKLRKVTISGIIFDIVGIIALILFAIFTFTFLFAAFSIEFISISYFLNLFIKHLVDYAIFTGSIVIPLAIIYGIGRAAFYKKKAIQMKNILTQVSHVTDHKE